MSEQKGRLLSPEEIQAIQARSDAKHLDYPLGRAVHDVENLLGHIQAMREDSDSLLVDQHTKIIQLQAQLEKEREDWQDVQRRVQDARDALGWRETDVKQLREAAQKVLDDCKAVGVEPVGAAALRDVIAETEKANGPG